MVRIRIVSITILLALLVATNSHLPLMQVVAWAGMLIDYSRDAGFSDAIEMTFDGEHPCSMCKAIQAEQEKTDPDAIRGESLARILLFIEPPFVWRQKISQLDTLEFSPSFSSRLPAQPDTPPPRSAAC